MYKEYKVIEIVSDKQILIDYGLEHGAEKGNSLRIIEKGEPVIIDGINYGAMDLIKEIVTVSIPYEKFSVCQKIITTSFDMMSPLTRLKRETREIATLNVNAEDISNRTIKKGSSSIKKGDIAILTNE